MNDSMKFITGLLVGGALGLGAGLLLAPATGKQARKKIRKASRKLARKMAGYMGLEQEVQRVSVKKRNGKTPIETI